ncbi:hypothetical protein BH23BAC4_BH23BAC4_13740 [soil metagenome]
MPPITQSHLDRIHDAVAHAETQSSGEIIPYLVERSGRYEIAYWRAGVFGAAIGLLLVVLAQRLGLGGWEAAWLYTAGGLSIAIIVGACVALGATALLPGLQRFLAGGDRMAERVHKRAAMAFISEEVFATTHRTGILILVSLFEHRIEVLGDTGISSRVDPDQWADVVEAIRDGIRKGELGKGLAEGVRRCGELLKNADLPEGQTGDVVLENRLRFSKR